MAFIIIGRDNSCMLHAARGLIWALGCFVLDPKLRIIGGQNEEYYGLYNPNRDNAFFGWANQQLTN